MDIDPQMQVILQEIREANIPSLAQLTPTEARLLPSVRQQNETAAETEDIELPGPAGPIPLRIYRPGSAQSPGMVFFHGGGWVLGSVDAYDGLCRTLCDRAGCTVLSVEYRLAPEHRFPAGAEDCFAATHWISEHEERLGITGDCLVVCGDSAGGNLAATVSYLAREAGGPRVVGQVLIYPVVSFDEDTQSMLEYSDGPLLNRSELEWFRDYYLRSPADTRDPLAAPLLIPDLTGLPSTLIVTADFDPLRDGAALFAERLRMAGVPVVHTNYEGVFHGFVEHYGRLDQADRAIDEICDWLSRAVPIVRASGDLAKD